MNTLKVIARFLNLLDRNNRLSLTNLTVWITMVKLAMAENVAQPLDVAAFIGAIVSYQAKRHIDSKKQSDEQSNS